MVESRGNLEEIAFPVLTEQEIDSLESFAACNVFADGEHLFDAGDVDFKFYVVVDGAVEIVEKSSGEPRRVTLHEAGEFTGDVDMLSGKATLVSAIARGETKVYEVPGDDLQNLVADLPDLGEKILSAFIARRELLLESDYEGLQVFGPGRSSETLRIQEFLGKNRVPFTWLDPEKEPVIQAMLSTFGVGPADMPVVINEKREIFRNPTIGLLANRLNIRHVPEEKLYDLIIVGAGPAGLAAAVYGASEGLSTIVLEQIGPGGQAGSSSKIENYLGFPTGLSGSDLAGRAILQAQKFGARISSPSPVSGIDGLGYEEDWTGCFRVRLEDDTVVEGRSILIATGASYRKLPATGRERFEGAGVYYAATTIESQLCSDAAVVVVGGGNSAGQAAMFLSGTSHRVYLVLRGDDLRKAMSSYLADRIEACENIEVRLNTEISRMDGEKHLEQITLVRSGEEEKNGDGERLNVAAVFTFIGAEPCTGWIPDRIARDRSGFILTGYDAGATGKWPLDRPPFYLETSVPGIFVAGDVRSGSIKRVASAVGEGSMAVKFVHEHLARPELESASG